MYHIIQSNKNLTIILSFLLLICICNLILLPYIPSFQKIPYRDSGVFLYIGEKILDGKLPYRDVWDHKPPVIFYINAFALFLSNGSYWGIWYIQLIFLLFGVILSFYLLNDLFGYKIAFLCSALWVINLSLIIEGGNLTEEYGIIIQFLLILLLYKHFKESKNIVKIFIIPFFIGFFSMIVFLLKPNLIGIPVSIIFALIVLKNDDFDKTIKNKIFILLAIISSFLLTFLFILYYFALNDALNDFIDCVFVYNFIYSSGNTLPQFLISILSGFKYLTIFGLIALLMWLFLIINHFKNYLKYTQMQKVLLLLVLIDFLIEMILSGVSGRTYPHYYMAWIPVVTILIAFFWDAFFKLINFKKNTKNRYFNTQKIIFLLLLIGILIIPLRFQNYLIYSKIYKEPSDTRINEVIEFLERSTSENDTILMWGAETSINYIVKRDSPTKYVYQYPLFMDGYLKPDMIDKFNEHILLNRPKFIIDTSATNKEIPSLDANKRQNWKSIIPNHILSPLHERIFRLLETHYQYCITIGPGWQVYEYKFQ